MSVKRSLKKMRSEGRFVGPIDLLATLWYEAENLSDRFHRNEVMQALRDRAFGSHPESWVEFAMTAGNGFLRPMQNSPEIRRLIEKVQELKPRTILEVGTARGGTLLLFCQSGAEDAEIISLDLPHGKNGGGYPKWKEPIYQLFARPEQRLTLLRANSHLEESRKRVERVIHGKKFDLIMIDADHSYQGVKRDFELYSPLVSERGIMILHDILPNRFDPEIDVHRFWREVSTAHQCEEIVDDYQQGCLGIGVVIRLGERRQVSTII